MLQKETTCAVCGCEVRQDVDAVRIESKSVFASREDVRLRNGTVKGENKLSVSQGIDWLKTTQSVPIVPNYTKTRKDLQEYRWGKEEAVKARKAAVEELSTVSKELGIEHEILFGEDELRDQSNNNITDGARNGASVLPIPELVYGVFACAQCAMQMLQSFTPNPRSPFVLSIQHPADFELAFDFFRFLDASLLRGVVARLYRDSSGVPLLRIARAGLPDVVVDLHRREE